MTPADLISLAERVERASGPDRELDALIAATCRLGAEKWSWADGYPEWEGRSDGRVYLEAGGPSFAAAAYTASLDAATTLVPGGTNSFGERFSVEGWDGCGVHAPHVRAAAWVAGAPRVYAATPALALTAAALRARAAQEQTDDG